MANNDNSELPQVDIEEALTKAAHAIKDSTAIILTSGAGLGVDSGLPDFRGPQGFWRAYPPMQKLGLRFEEMSNPQWFEKDPKFAWGFWFHRYSLYSSSTPHEGYYIMKEMAENRPHGYFVFTSNVDGHWRKTGIPDDKLEECHGTVDFMQCCSSCTEDIWLTTDTVKECEIDTDTFHATSPLPACKYCGKLARPNVLMFGDWSWNGSRRHEQMRNFQQFQKQLTQQKDAKLVIIEVGAGKAVPTVRKTSQNIAKEFNGTLIRINLRDYDMPSSVNGIGIPLGGKEALQKLKEKISTL
mmetsp:Transcript_24842/g.34780  ORF Transcript_24842/g.34780 Transcript_24842/m.34780 type:complete len:298 (+) Transcript_24842:48-941(+)